MEHGRLSGPPVAEGPAPFAGLRKTVRAEVVITYNTNYCYACVCIYIYIYMFVGSIFTIVLVLLLVLVLSVLSFLVMLRSSPMT